MRFLVQAPVAHEPSTSSPAPDQRLQAPQLQERLLALHQIEQLAEHQQNGPRAEAARRALRLTERGLPYYAPQDPAYARWVQKAAECWDALTTDAGPTTH